MGRRSLTRRRAAAKRRAAAGETQNLPAAAEPEFLATLETTNASKDESPAESLADETICQVMIWLDKNENEASDAESRASSARNAKNTETVQSETLPRKKAKVNAKVSMCKKGEPKIVNEEKEEEPLSDKLATDKLEHMCETFTACKSTYDTC